MTLGEKIKEARKNMDFPKSSLRRKWRFQDLLLQSRRQITDCRM